MPQRIKLYTNLKFSAHAPQKTHPDRGPRETPRAAERGPDTHYNTAAIIKLAELSGTPRPAGSHPLPHPQHDPEVTATFSNVTAPAGTVFARVTPFANGPIFAETISISLTRTFRVRSPSITNGFDDCETILPEYSTFSLFLAHISVSARSPDA